MIDRKTLWKRGTLSIVDEKERLKSDYAARWLEAKEREIWRRKAKARREPERRIRHIFCRKCARISRVQVPSKWIKVPAGYRCPWCASKSVRIARHSERHADQPISEAELIRKRTEALRDEMFPNERLPWED